jgi:hypothetical protein
MPRIIAITPLVLALAVMATDTSAQGQSNLTRVGTLSCTTDALPPESVADAELSCNFEAVSGRSERFTGFIARQGMADLPPGKRILIWSVLAPKKEIDPRSLSGRYAGETGGKPPGQMAGGEGNAIVLQPSTPESQIGDTLVPTMLSLRLEPLKA